MADVREGDCIGVYVFGPFDGLAHEPCHHGVRPVCVVLAWTLRQARNIPPAPANQAGGPLELSLPLQGQPCGRPPAAAVLGRQPQPQGSLAPERNRLRERTNRESTPAFTQLASCCARNRTSRRGVPVASYPTKDRDRLCSRAPLDRGPLGTSRSLEERSWTHDELHPGPVGRRTPWPAWSSISLISKAGHRQRYVLPRRLWRLANEARVVLDGSRPSPELEPPAARGEAR